MRNLSLGAGLVVRQLLFLTLMVFMGAAAYVGVVHLRDLTATTGAGGPAQILAVLAVAHDAANSLAIELAIGTVVSALLILCVSVPTMNATISAPIKLITDLTGDDLAVLAAHDSDPFNRWQAIQSIAMTLLVENVAALRAGKTARTDNRLTAALAAALDDDSLEPAFVALVLAPPGEADLPSTRRPPPQSLCCAAAPGRDD